MTLLGLIELHHDSFAVDWRRSTGMPLAAIFDGRIRWPEAWAHAQAILRDPDSHLQHDIQGSSYVPPPEERIGFLFFEADLNSKRAKNRIPISIPRPWAGSGATQKAETLVPADSPERLEALERLRTLGS